MKNIITNENKFLLNLTKLTLNKDEITFMVEYVNTINNWDEILIKIKTRGIANTAYKCIKNNDLEAIFPDLFLIPLKKIYIAVFFNNSAKIKQLQEISYHLEHNNIGFALLKGIMLLPTIYKSDFGLRIMSDIDLLLREEDINRSLPIFENLGWEIINVESKKSNQIRLLFSTHHPYILKKDNITIEVHNKLHNSNSTYDLNIHFYWKNSIVNNWKNIKSYYFNIEDLLIHLCVHLYKHLFNEKNIALKHFTDIHEFLIFYKENINWEMIEKKIKLYNCKSEFTEVIYLCQLFYNSPVFLDIKIAANQENILSEIFLMYLNQDKEKINEFHSIRALEKSKITKNVKSRKIALQYYYYTIFPSKEFIFDHYNIKHSLFWQRYYFIRVYETLKK